MPDFGNISTINLDNAVCVIRCGNRVFIIHAGKFDFFHAGRDSVLRIVGNRHMFWSYKEIWGVSVAANSKVFIKILWNYAGKENCALHS